jgi:hemolysin activation/secretion protein
MRKKFFLLYLVFFINLFSIEDIEFKIDKMSIENEIVLTKKNIDKQNSTEDLIIEKEDFFSSNIIKKITLKGFEKDNEDNISTISIKDLDLQEILIPYIGLNSDENLKKNIKKDLLKYFKKEGLEIILIKEKNENKKFKILEVNLIFNKTEIENASKITNLKDPKSYLQIKEEIDDLLEPKRLFGILITEDTTKQFLTKNIMVDIKINQRTKIEEDLYGYIRKVLDSKTKRKISQIVYKHLKDKNFLITNVEEFKIDNKKVLKILVKKNEIEKQKLETLFCKEDVIIDEITALIFSTDPTILDAKELSGIYGIEVNGIELKNQSLFVQKMQHFLLSPLTFQTLQDIKKETLTYFKKTTPYLVDVKILDNQDITTGKIQIFLMFAKLSEITSEGAKYFSNEKILKKLYVYPNQYIDLNNIKNFLIFENKNPFRNVSVIYEPADKLGYSDIRIVTKDIFPLRAYAAYQSNAYTIAGYSRYMAGFNVGNFLNLDHQLNFEFKTADPTSLWWGVSGNYILPFLFKNYFKIIGSFVKTKNPDIQTFDPTPSMESNFETNGKSYAILSRYHIPIKSFFEGTQEFILGFDFKQTNNFVAFNKQILKNDKIDISQFLIKIEGNINDRYGMSSYSLSIYVSPGEIGKYNKSNNFQVEGYAQSASYAYANLHFDRLTKLGSYFEWISDLYFQFSNKKLLPTEQFVLGGHDTIRGYQENAVFADQGFYFKNELRSKQIAINKIKNFDQKIQFLAFLDLGAVADTNKNLFTQNNQFLASAGPGIRYSGKENVIFSADYGIQLKNFKRKYFKKPWHSIFHIYGSLQF